MSEFLSTLPEWAQNFIGWFLTGSNLASLLTTTAALFKLSGTKKQNEILGNTQVNLLTTMTDKLSDTRNLAIGIQNVSEQIGQVLTSFQNALTEQRQANANLALFVMECFNESNLSAEAKARLQVMADKIFYADNTKVIEVLQQAKVAADEAVEEGLIKIAELQKQLEEKQKELVIAQENVKESRRV